MPPPDPDDDAARRLGANAADDIVADTFLDAFRKRHQYNLGVSNARPWLYGIASGPGVR
jgi:RNA polymerase sigma-70 factor, ECF subfamily